MSSGEPPQAGQGPGLTLKAKEIAGKTQQTKNQDFKFPASHWPPSL
jgi:hypothetical protein